MKIRTENQTTHISRGIAIILVVLGHILSTETLAFRWIFSFHMSFFFLISGYCMGLNYKITTHRFFSMIKSLIVPSIIVRIIWAIIYRYSYSESLHFFMTPGAEWFFAALFLARVIYALLCVLRKKIGNDGICYFLMAEIAVSLPLMAYWYVDMGFNEKINLFFPLDCTFLGLFFVIIGGFLKEYCEKKEISVEKLGDIFKGRKQLLALGCGCLLSLPLIWRNGWINIFNISTGRSEVLFAVMAVFWFCAASHFQRTVSNSERQQTDSYPYCIWQMKCCGLSATYYFVLCV